MEKIHLYRFPTGYQWYKKLYSFCGQRWVSVDSYQMKLDAFESEKIKEKYHKHQGKFLFLCLLSFSVNWLRAT